MAGIMHHFGRHHWGCDQLRGRCERRRRSFLPLRRVPRAVRYPPRSTRDQKDMNALGDYCTLSTGWNGAWTAPRNEVRRTAYSAPGRFEDRDQRHIAVGNIASVTSSRLEAQRSAVDRHEPCGVPATFAAAGATPLTSGRPKGRAPSAFPARRQRPIRGTGASAQDHLAADEASRRSACRS